MNLYTIWYHSFSKENTYVKVRDIHAEDLDDVFVKSQGEVYSPRGEANSHLESIGADHTSMCVGDFIETSRGEFYRVEGCGFEKYDSLPVKGSIYAKS
jgi:hypothetical protein